MEKDEEKILKKIINNPCPLPILCKTMTDDSGYHWGGKEYIPRLLGLKNTQKKSFAEIWIGAHPKGPAALVVKNKKINLYEVIKLFGNKILGAETNKKYENKLPYLMKVLSASKPLSIQAHPEKQKAKEGWKKEKGKGPNYKDDNHKPELICALTKFWALKGFRNGEEIIKDFDRLKISEINNILDDFKTNLTSSKNSADKKNALKVFYTALMTTPKDKMNIIVNKIIKKVFLKRIIFLVIFPFYLLFKNTREYWILKSKDSSIIAIDEDIKKNNISSKIRDGKIKEALYGIPVIYLLNLIRLKRGEALFLEPGELHSYLRGSGIEIMANSDNVLRAGLTHKHIDTKELLYILTFNLGKAKKVIPEQKSSTEFVYKTEAKEFELSKIVLKNNNIFISSPVHSADSLIVLDGLIEIVDINDNKLFLKKGETALIPANVRQYKIKSIAKKAAVFKASVPL